MPCNWIVYGLFAALSETLNNSFLDPAPCGWKLTWKAQDWPAGNAPDLEGHVVLTTLKSGPILQRPIVSVPPRLVSIKVCAAER